MLLEAMHLPSRKNPPQPKIAPSEKARGKGPLQVPFSINKENRKEKRREPMSLPLIGNHTLLTNSMKILCSLFSAGWQCSIAFIIISRRPLLDDDGMLC